MVAARFASSAPAPSLYYAVDTAEFPRATLIASERPFASDAWQTVAEDEILSCDTQLQLEHIVFHPREAVTRASGSSESAA